MTSMISVRKLMGAGFFVSVSIALLAIYLFMSKRYETDAYYEAIKTVSQMDARYGKPMYVIRDYPTVIADGYISEEEMKHGMVLRVYVIRNFPSSLMAFVKHKTGEDRISGKTTYVP